MNKNAKAIKAVMANCYEIPTACEKINAVPQTMEREKRKRNETVPNDEVPPIKKT